MKLVLNPDGVRALDVLLRFVRPQRVSDRAALSATLHQICVLWQDALQCLIANIANRRGKSECGGELAQHKYIIGEGGGTM
jgi:hypothetical protein